jgi:hypothetical protein
MVIFAILLVSYLLRGILNYKTVVNTLNSLNCYNFPYNWGYCLFLLGFYAIELFIPLQLLFYFQFCKCKSPVFKESLINTQITTSDGAGGLSPPQSPETPRYQDITQHIHPSHAIS